jgi:hypothetical protein
LLSAALWHGAFMPGVATLCLAQHLLPSRCAGAAAAETVYRACWMLPRIYCTVLFLQLLGLLQQTSAAQTFGLDAKPQPMIHRVRGSHMLTSRARLQTKNTVSHIPYSCDHLRLGHDLFSPSLLLSRQLLLCPISAPTSSRVLVSAQIVLVITSILDQGHLGDIASSSFQILQGGDHETICRPSLYSVQCYQTSLKRKSSGWTGQFEVP